MISGIKIRRYAGPIMTILAGVVISFMGFALALHWDRQVIRNEFIREADNHFEAINREVEFNLHTLSSLKTFYDSIGELDRTEFRDLAEHLLSLHSTVQAIEWIPRVPHADRPAYEEASRQAGFPYFQITERETGGEIIRATERQEYFPVYFVEPYRGNEVALGFDLASDRMRREALQRARDAGDAVATGRIKLVQETAGRFGFLVFSPIYHKGLPEDSILTRGENLKGFILGVFTVDEIVEKSLTYLKPGGIDIYVYDKSAPPEESFLYFHPSRTRKPSNLTAEPAEDAHFEHSRILTLPNREWLVLMKAAPGFVAARETWRPLGGLLGGLLLSGALASYLIIQKRSKETLEEQLNFLQSLIDTIPSPIFYKDINGVYLGCNTAFEAYIGRPKIEIVGKTVYDVAPEDLADKYHKADLALLLAPGVQSYEASVQYADGIRHNVLFTKATFFDAEGKIAGMVGVMIDITARKRAEAESVRLVTAVEQLAEGIMIADTNWIIQYANPAFERISGYDRDELIGQHTRILKNDHYDRAFYKGIRETLAGGEVWLGHVQERKKDGTLYDVEALVSPVRDEAGNIYNYVSIHRDITREVRLERELRQSQKMESIGTLAGGIAHDFNNILTSIIGYTEMAQTRVQEGSLVKRNLDQVLRSGFRARDLVKQILTISRQTEQERKPVQICPVVKEALKLLRSSLPTTVEIRQEIAVRPGEGVVLADPTQIHQVLMNLCTNAAHAMRPQGGILSVNLSEVEFDASLVCRYPGLRPGPYVKLIVSDTGCGMDAAVMERIFDPYFTTKGPGEGTGLGLSVVQGIVKSHGGAITVHSTPGEGTVFEVFLPRLEEAVITGVESVEPLPTGSEHILFVDDEETLVDLGRDILKSLGYSVTIRTHSLAALETFRAEPGAYDLLITDLTMPGITGLGLAKEVMATRADVPVILCTGFSDQINAEQARDVGVREVVMKPYDVATLAKTIRRVLQPR